MKEQLIFDPSIVNFKEEHDRVGAHLLNASGDVLTTGDGSSDDLANTFKALDTRAFAFGYDASGNNWDRLKATNGALHVDIQDANINVIEEDVYAEDSAHATSHKGSFNLSVRMADINGSNAALLAGNEGDYQGTFTNNKGELYVTDRDAISELQDVEADIEAVHATLIAGIDVNLRDGAANDITSRNAELAVVDLVNALDNSARTDIGTTAALPIKATAAQTNRKKAWLFNNSKKKMFLGKVGITAANGFPFPPGSMYEFALGAAAAMHALGTSTADDQDLRLMEGAA